MEMTDPFVFQADSDIVNNVYESNPNYLIEYNNLNPKDYCIIYCSSNNIYYPNDEIVFAESIVKKNRFEWYGNRINYGYKHIFLRDVKKQWYLTGVNSTINDPEKLLSFLKKETLGYKIILVGSSAGGFISTILGQQLKAEAIYTFNGQFEIYSLLEKETAPQVDPILYRNKNNAALLPFYDALNFIDDPKTIFYFHSKKSKWDISQLRHLKEMPLNKILFNTSNHGIPFLKSNLPVVLNLPKAELKELSGKTIHPLIFSLQLVGLAKTLDGIKTVAEYILDKAYKKILRRKKK